MVALIIYTILTLSLQSNKQGASLPVRRHGAASLIGTSAGGGGLCEGHWLAYSNVVNSAPI